MLLKEVMLHTGLSKKAIQYYEDQKLIVPDRLENGYREYSLDCVQKLRTIKQCRILGMPVEKIRLVLQDRDTACNIYQEQILDIEYKTVQLQKQKQLLLDLKEGKNITEQELENLQVVRPFVYTEQYSMILLLFEGLCFIIALLCYEYIPSFDEIWGLGILMILAVAAFYYIYLVMKYQKNAPLCLSFSLKNLLLFLGVAFLTQLLIMSFIRFAQLMMPFTWGVLLGILCEAAIVWLDVVGVKNLERDLQECNNLQSKE